MSRPHTPPKEKKKPSSSSCSGGWPPSLQAMISAWPRISRIGLRRRAGQANGLPESITTAVPNVPATSLLERAVSPMAAPSLSARMDDLSQSQGRAALPESRSSIRWKCPEANNAFGQCLGRCCAFVVSWAWPHFMNSAARQSQNSICTGTRRVIDRFARRFYFLFFGRPKAL